MFETRAAGVEYLDAMDMEDSSIASSYRFTDAANRLLGGLRAVRRFVVREAAAAGGRPLEVLDVGCGACDLPLAVSAWARRRRLDVRFTCLDCHERAMRLARTNLARRKDSAVRLVCEDIFRHRPEQPYDCATASLFLHHLSDQGILTLMDHLRRFVRRSVLISDLRRGAGNYLGWLLAGLHLPQKVRHDTLLSVRRGFTAEELRRLLGAIPGATATVRESRLGLIQALVRF